MQKRGSETFALSELNLDYDEARSFCARKPDWCRSDQTLEKAATLIAAASFANPGAMIEIGTSAGEGAAALLHGSRKNGSTLDAIDVAETVYYNPNKTVGSAVAESFPEYMDRFRTHLGKDARYALSIGKKFTLVHIDGHHSHPWALYDFLCVLPALEDGAIVLFDDANYTAPLSQAAYYIGRRLRGGAFIHAHYVYRYSKNSATLANDLQTIAEIPWQTGLNREHIDALATRLSGVMDAVCEQMLIGSMFAMTAQYAKNKDLFDPLAQRAWKGVLELRRLQEQMKTDS